MRPVLDPRLQQKMRVRPSGDAAMLQRWDHLAFLHCAADPQVVQATLPPGLLVDTFVDGDGVEKAWIGLVAFSMQGIRPPFLPAVPWVSTFLETNVRTYVHRNGSAPGVYFYSLDAQRLLACDFARAMYGLNYLHSEMSLLVGEDAVDYRIRRLDEPHADMRLKYSIGDALELPQPGSFEFFLAERYLLYAVRRGRLGVGRVWHEPYPLRSAEVRTLESGIVESQGLPWGPLSHTLYSPGVDVEVFPFEPLV